METPRYQQGFPDRGAPPLRDSRPLEHRFSVTLRDDFAVAEQEPGFDQKQDAPGDVTQQRWQQTDKATHAQASAI